MKTLSSIATYKKGKPPKTGSHGRLPVLSPHYLRTGQIEEMAEPTSKDVILKGGELILLWDGSNAGEFFRARAGVLSSTMVAFEFDQEETNPDYLYYDLKRFEPELKGRTAGSGIPHVDKEVLLARRVFEGGPNEQKAAAKVLLKIDRAIEQTEALLEKQQRIKTGLMHDLLTRGLDPQGRLRHPTTHQFKSSRIGPIPKEWEVRALDWCLDGIDAGKSPNCFERPAGPGEWGVLKVSAVGKSGFVESENKTLPPTLTPNLESRVRSSDLLIQRSNTFELVGSVCLVGEVSDNLLLCDKTLRLNVDESLADKRFLLAALKSSDVRRQIEMAAAGSSGSMKNIGQLAIRGLRIAAPQLEEQIAIADSVAKLLADVSGNEADLAKLCRLKNGLMHDLLTGRVSVTPLLAKPEAQDSS